MWPSIFTANALGLAVAVATVTVMKVLASLAAAGTIAVAGSAALE